MDDMSRYEIHGNPYRDVSVTHDVRGGGTFKIWGLEPELSYRLLNTTLIL